MPSFAKLVRPTGYDMPLQLETLLHRSSVCSWGSGPADRTTSSLKLFYTSSLPRAEEQEAVSAANSSGRAARTHYHVMHMKWLHMKGAAR